MPSFISCKTIIGFGSPNKAGTAGVHGSPLGDEEIKIVRELFDWDHKPFDIPQHIIKAWHKSGSKNSHVRKQWTDNLNNLSQKRRNFSYNLFQARSQLNLKINLETSKNDS